MERPMLPLPVAAVPEADVTEEVFTDDVLVPLVPEFSPSIEAAPQPAIEIAITAARPHASK
jgi:hypothetical protein